MPSFQLPEETKVSQVHLRVRDMGTVLEFYTHAVGLQVINSNSTDADVSLSATGRSSPLLVLTEDKQAPLRLARTTGLYHTAFRFPTRRDLAHALRRVTAGGYAIDGASDHIFSEAIYLDDPEGNGVELYVDRPRSHWPQLGGNMALSPPRPFDIRALLAATGSEPVSPAAPPETDIGHIHLHVGDLGLAERFFHEFIGLDVMIRAPGALFVSAGGYHHHIGANTWAGAAPSPPGSNGLMSYRLDVPVAEVLYCLRNRAPLAGHVTQDAVTVNGGELLRIRDPNDLWLEMSATLHAEGSGAEATTSASTAPAGGAGRARKPT